MGVEIMHIASDRVKGPFVGSYSVISFALAVLFGFHAIAAVGPLTKQGVAFNRETGGAVTALICGLPQSQLGRDNIHPFEQLSYLFLGIVYLLRTVFLGNGLQT